MGTAASILVVDDQLALRDNVRQALEEAGAQSRVCSTRMARPVYGVCVQGARHANARHRANASRA